MTAAEALRALADGDVIRTSGTSVVLEWRLGPRGIQCRLGGKVADAWTDAVFAAAAGDDYELVASARKRTARPGKPKLRLV